MLAKGDDRRAIGELRAKPIVIYGARGSEWPGPIARLGVYGIPRSSNH